MKNYAIVFGLLIVTSLSANAFARDKFCCIDPNLQQIQTQCCQGTLLPYHVALKRADDATKAEAALAHMTQENKNLQAQLAKLQADLKTAVADRDKSRGEQVAAVAERDKAAPTRPALPRTRRNNRTKRWPPKKPNKSPMPPRSRRRTNRPRPTKNQRLRKRNSPKRKTTPRNKWQPLKTPRRRPLPTKRRPSPPPRSRPMNWLKRRRS